MDPFPKPTGTNPAKAAETPPPAAPGRRRLYVWAESPEQRRLIEQSLSPDSWTLLPTSQNGPALVKLIRSGGADGIIFHYREDMPEVMENLHYLQAELPECPRIVVCAEEARRAFRIWPGIPPTVLREGATTTENEEKIARAIALNQWLVQPAILPVLSRLRSIPTLPEAHQRVVEALRDPDFSAPEVSRLIANDPALTTNLFKTVNSAAFGLGRPVDTIADAITMLGVERLRALVLSAWAFHFIDDKTCAGFNPQAEWEHALAVAAETRKLGTALGAEPNLVESAFTAGVLHDVGKLLLAANTPEAYALILAEARDGNRQLCQVEKEDLGFSHAEIGGCMLGIWGTALPIVEAAAWHHEPSRAANQRLSPLTLVHLADCRVRGVAPDPAQSKLAGMT